MILVLMPTVRSTPEGQRQEFRTRRCLGGRDPHNINQFLAGGEALPLSIFVHDRQTPVAITLNPVRFFCRWRCQVQVNFRLTEFNGTIHHLKFNSGRKPPLITNCRRLCVFC